MRRVLLWAGVCCSANARVAWHARAHQMCLLLTTVSAGDAAAGGRPQEGAGGCGQGEAGAGCHFVVARLWRSFALGAVVATVPAPQRPHAAQGRMRGAPFWCAGLACVLALCRRLLAGLVA